MRYCQDGLAAIAGLPMRFDNENMARLFRYLSLLICLWFLPAAWADEMPQLTLLSLIHI